MRISRYEIFLKVAELGSLTQAAAYFHYSQSAVSQSLKNLEQELGVILISREKHGVHLTEEGQTLLPYCQDIVFAQMNLSHKIAQLQNLQVGKLRIASISSLSCHWLPQYLQAFHQAYPNVEIQMRQGDYAPILQWLRNKECDIGCLIRPSASGFHFEKRLEDRLMAVLPVGHPLAGQKTLPIQALANEHFLLVDSDYRELVAAAFRKAGLRPHVPYWIQDDYTIMSMVEQGLGISIMPELVLQRTAYQICCIPLENMPSRELGLVTREGESLSWVSQKFMKMVRD